MQRVDFSLAVHGGAWNMPVAVIDSHIIGRQNALEVVEEILRGGGSAIDVVEKSSHYLGSRPYINI